MYGHTRTESLYQARTPSAQDLRLWRSRDRSLRPECTNESESARCRSCPPRRSLVTGATTGFPLWAAMGAKEVGGISIGLSPAATEKEHIQVYKLPVDYMDLIIYTGFGYQMRDILLTRSSDAVVLGCGRIGTIHEFTVAFEDNKPIGILEDEGWEMGREIQAIIRKGHRPNNKIVFDTDPKKLIEKIVELIYKDKDAAEENKM